MENKKKEKDSKTAGENVYNFLRTSIIELRVKPGQIINIKELSEFLKVSRSPIRDALIQLGKDGLVTTTPQKGTCRFKNRRSEGQRRAFSARLY
jgi:DNA-binding GntR family transcriptional regulator